ncbi:hypothetical protein CAAU_1144 [Caloramator australicus RC3]|uniref:Uncharacterized protein n=1 Tax=Caloramator australicus RC3 TaxID=857293 RepID=I7KTS5_9CLOT|nr:hypothetical protein CAAU_1144 [Caloramator australicus RC3]
MKIKIKSKECGKMHQIFKLITTIITGFITGIFFALPLGPAGLESIKQT